MNTIQLIHFTCVISYLYLAVYIIIRNHKSLLNWSCTAVILTFCHWSFSLIFVHDPDVSKETASLFYYIGSFAWASYVSVAMWFVMVFIDNKRVLRSKLFYLSLVVPPVLVIYGQWTGEFAADYVLQPWGWAFIWSNSFWTYFLSVYYFVYMTFGIYLVVRHARRIDDPVKKKQAMIICYATIVSLVLATSTDSILPRMGIHIIPNMAPDFMIIWMVGLVVAIGKYGMLEITPSLAADKIIATMSDSLLLLDEKWRIILANRAARNLLFYEDEELAGRTIDMFFPDGVRDKQMNLLIEGGDVVGHDFLLAAKNGEEIPVIFSKSVIRGTTGSAIGIVCLARDITERKRAEEEVKSYSVQLEAANKELESFSHSVSHDLRAPLRALGGFSQILLQDYPDKLDEKGKDYLQRISRNAQRMAQLVNDLLMLSRVTSAEMRQDQVDMSTMAQGTISMLRQSDPERKVEVIIEDDLTAEGDHRLLRQVLENLLSNAWKFTGTRPQARIEFGTIEHEGRTAYFVRDNGAGFDMKYADKLFIPFQRLHGVQEFPGTGVGLCTVQRIVNRHGGRIWFEGEVDRGATFYFMLHDKK